MAATRLIALLQHFPRDIAAIVDAYAQRTDVEKVCAWIMAVGVQQSGGGIGLQYKSKTTPDICTLTMGNLEDRMCDRCLMSLGSRFCDAPLAHGIVRIVCSASGSGIWPIYHYKTSLESFIGAIRGNYTEWKWCLAGRDRNVLKEVEAVLALP